MKKDKAWLIKRVENYIPLNDKTVGHVVDNILDIIHELDEPEKVGYEVEKLYRVEMPGTTDITLLTLEGDEYYFDEPLYYVGEMFDIRQEFTELEIRAVDERYWQFAVGVE